MSNSVFRPHFLQHLGSELAQSRLFIRILWRPIEMATTDTLITLLASTVIESHKVDHAVALLLLYDYTLQRRGTYCQTIIISCIPSFVPQGRILLDWFMVTLQASLPHCKSSLCSLCVSFFFHQAPHQIKYMSLRFAL